MSTLSPQSRTVSSMRRGFRVTSDFTVSSQLLVLLLGALLFIRVLTDHLSSPYSRHSGSIDLSGGIASVFIVLATGLLLRRRQGLRAALLAAFWLCTWTALAVNTSGATTETLREGVREGSVVALAVIIFNAREALTVPIAARLVQLIGLVPAVLALHQLASGTGMDVQGNARANGTFAHPNSAAMFFALAAVTSIWLYLDKGRRRYDAFAGALFAAALIATFSIDGLVTLFTMLVVLGLLRPGSWRVKLGPGLIAGLIVVAYLATPLGAKRIAMESTSRLATSQPGTANSSLSWRFYKWKSLLPEWERAPILGRGLGTTTTNEGTATNQLPGDLPHNEYIRYLVETGVVGLMILIGAVLALVRSLAQKRRLRDLRLGAANGPVLALVVIVGCLVDSLADNTLLNSPTCYAATLIIIAALSSQAAQARRSPTLDR